MRVIYPADLFVLAFGAAVLFVWFVLFAAGYRHAALFDKLAKEDYPLKELYFVGFALLKYVKKKIGRASCRERVLRAV